MLSTSWWALSLLSLGCTVSVLSPANPHRCLHALWHRAAAVDGLGSHGSLLCVCSSLVAAAQVVSPHRA